MDRSLNLTAEVMFGELGLDVVVGVNMISPEGTTASILCMTSIKYAVSATIFASILFQMNQILSLAVVNFSPLVRP